MHLIRFQGVQVQASLVGINGRFLAHLLWWKDTHTHIHTHHTLTHVLVCSPKALTCAHTPTLKHRCAHPHSRMHTHTRKPWLPSNIWPHIFEVRSCPSSTFAGHVVDLWRLSQAVFVGHCLHSLHHCKSPVSMHRVWQERNTVSSVNSPQTYYNTAIIRSLPQTERIPASSDTQLSCGLTPCVENATGSQMGWPLCSLCTVQVENTFAETDAMSRWHSHSFTSR